MTSRKDLVSRWCIFLYFLAGITLTSIPGVSFLPSVLFSPAWGEETSGVATLTPEQREVLTQQFGATEATFTEDGKLRLVYNFEERDEQLLEDFSPHPSKTKRRIRWSQGYEGTFRTVATGLVIADKGRWVHNAHWLDDVKIQVEYMSMSMGKQGDLVAAGMFYDKGRRFVGSNCGEQCVRLKGMSHSGKPHPVEFPVMSSEQRCTFGMKMDRGAVVSLRGDRKTFDTAANEKFIKKFEGRGMPGLLWKGRVNGFVFKIIIEGTLDPQWVSRSLGLKGQVTAKK